MASDAPSIVVAVDRSDSSRELLRIAARLAELVDGRLDVVHVLGAVNGAGATEQESELDASLMLDELCAAAGAGSPTRHVIRYGDPARRVAAIADERNALVIVVGAREEMRGGDALIGSVSSRLAADAPCPVLVIPRRLERQVRPQSWRGRTFVSGFDGSPPSWGAARHAAALAEMLDGSLSVVSVGPEARGAVPPDADELPALDVRHEHRAGDPAWELERVAAAITAPLIVIGSRGLGPWNDALLGSVARRLLRTARRPLLVLPAASLLQAESA